MMLFLPYVTSFIQNDVVNVGFSNDAYSPSEFVLLTQMLYPSDDDIAIDGGLPWIDITGKEASGVIESVNIEPGTVEIVLSEALAQSLGADHRIVIRCNAELPALRQAGQHMKSVVGNDRVKVRL